MSEYDSLGKDFLAKLVEQRKLSHLTSLEDVPACAKVASRIDPRRILETGISKAFFGKTDGIDSTSWEKARNRLRNMSLKEARGIWQTIANEVAVDCFDRDGNIDDDRLRTWMEFFGDVENFKTEPFCLIPLVELTRSQIHRVCECLVLNKNGARDLLNTAKNITVGQHGQSILEATSQGRKPPLKPAVAILAALFTPHRQFAMYTCTIHSTINAEIRNHPERLIQMYTQMLSGPQFIFPSGYAVQQQPMVNGFIPIDLKNGGIGKGFVLGSGWQLEGIEHDPAEKYKLRLPVYNMNDVLFAHFLLASNFGNGKMGGFPNWGIMLVYSGCRRFEELSSIISLYDIYFAACFSDSDFLDGMAKLKEQAEAQQKLGHQYMCVETGNHIENIDISALLTLDLDNMETGKAYAIGDRNYATLSNYDFNMSQDIPRLAVRKKRKKAHTISIYEFGTLEGSKFMKDDLRKFEVFTTDVKERDAQFWEQFKP